MYKMTKKQKEQFEKLPNFGCDCNCSQKKGTSDFIWKGEFEEVHTFCRSCGGAVV